MFMVTPSYQPVSVMVCGLHKLPATLNNATYFMKKKASALVSILGQHFLPLAVASGTVVSRQKVTWAKVRHTLLVPGLPREAHCPPFLLSQVEA